jgi:hypothetical protein
VLAGADAPTVKAMRSLNALTGDRQEVRAEVARVLTTSRASAADDHAHEEKAALVLLEPLNVVNPRAGR